MAGKSLEKARRIEEEAIGRSVVNDTLHRLPLPERWAFFHASHKRRKDRYGGLLEDIQRSSKAIAAAVQTHFATGRDISRPDKANDYFDIEFLIVPRAYSDVLAVRDKWMRSQMRTQLGPGPHQEHAGSLEELTAKLAHRFR